MADSTHSSDVAIQQTAGDASQSKLCSLFFPNYVVHGALQFLRPTWLLPRRIRQIFCFKSKEKPTNHKQRFSFPPNIRGPLFPNPGYYSRVVAISHLREKFLSAGGPEELKQIICLGAGMDTSFFLLKVRIKMLPATFICRKTETGHYSKKLFRGGFFGCDIKKNTNNEKKPRTVLSASRREIYR